jgi:hypothetical protein
MKKSACVIVAVMLLLLGSAIPGYASGHGGGHSGGHGHVAFRGGIFIGPGFWWGPGWWGPGWWGPSYPYYPSPPVVEQQPPVYVQPEPQTQQPNYWYYCQNPQGYYPYIQQCPGGWMTVVPPAAPPGR